ncbi:hypothetical protein [Saccharothrix sp. ALI-22-I]|uniref:hypothetical protein n=1 Tax=Saccharothrix sp. ALI-22-I TaxID=1933778 RepID=UPI00097C6A12|nr:hypothetical protein [Saccharothrix sp. ALI-22-I]
MTVRELTDLVDQEIQKALHETKTASPEDAEVHARSARDRLHDVLAFGVRAGDQLPLRQALACAGAACEHLEFGELLEARTLLTAAISQLALVRSASPQGA